jgi:hypothetical protein
VELRDFQVLFEMRWQRGLVVASPPATEETGTMSREIESRQGICW